MNEYKSIEQSATQWHMRVKEGLNAKERQAFEVWIAIEAHQKAYAAIERLIGNCLELDTLFVKELEESLLRNDAIHVNVWYQRRFFLTTLAACLVLILGFTLKHYFYPIFQQDYVTSNQKMLNITLPDATKIDLDIKSSAHVTYYNHKRTVDLVKGKAFFDVSKDAHKPFVIQAGETHIKVVGTKFEVSRVNNSITVSVLEGIVSVSDNVKNAMYQLKKAESIAFNESGKMLYYGKINTQKIADWKENTLLFDKTTLKDATAQFAYYTNQTVTFDNDAIASLKLSGKFHTTHFQGFIQSLEAMYGLKVRYEKENIHIVQK